MLKIAKNLTIPDEAVTQTFAILARRGAGKTYAASVMAEEMLGAGYPIVWLDPLGVAWGLRSDHSIVILGGKRGDAPLEPTGGRVVADFVVGERIPVILDVSLFGENEMRRFVAEFADQFYRKNEHAIHWFVDEADEFAPQHGSGAIAKCLGAMQNIVRRGRARGIGVTLITQRSAVLSKSVLTQTECLIAMQTTHPKDLRVIEEWISYHGLEKDEQRELIRSIPKFKPGEAWIYSPSWLDELKRVRIRKRRTFDSSNTPKPGEARQEPKKFTDVDLAALSKSMADTIERAKADDPTVLRKRIRELEGQLKTSKPVIDQNAIDRAVADRDREWKQQLVELQKANHLHVSIINQVHDITKLNGSASVSANPRPVKSNPRQSRVHQIKSRESSASTTSYKFGSGEMRMLRVLVDRHPAQFSESQWATLSRLKKSGGTWSTYKSRLRSQGMIDESGGLFAASDIAVSLFGAADREPDTPEEIREQWKSSLGGGSARVIDALLEHGELSREELAEAIGVSPEGGTFGTYLSRVRSNGLIEQNNGMYSLSSELVG